MNIEEPNFLQWKILWNKYALTLGGDDMVDFDFVTNNFVVRGSSTWSDFTDEGMFSTAVVIIPLPIPSCKNERGFLFERMNPVGQVNKLFSIVKRSEKKIKKNLLGKRNSRWLVKRWLTVESQKYCTDLSIILQNTSLFRRKERDD